MFLTEVHLSKNHWSFKLLQWTFPWIDRFHNFCPHFWLTILALILFIPVTIPVRFVYHVLVSWLIVKPIEYVVEKLTDFLDSRFMFLKPFEQELGMYLYDYWNFGITNPYSNDLHYTLPSCEYAKAKKYLRLFEALPYDKRQEFLAKFEKEKVNVDKKIQEMVEYYRKEREKTAAREIELAAKREEARKRKRNRKKVMIPRMMLLGKILGILIIIPAAIFLGYWLVMAIGWLWYWAVFYFPFVPWLTILYVLIGLALGGTILYVLYKATIALGSKLGSLDFDSCDRIRNFFKVVGAPFIWIGKALSWFFMGIGDAFIFVWTGIKSFKSNNCPAIIWEEKKEVK
jgi:hypothetical protein